MTDPSIVLHNFYPGIEDVKMLRTELETNSHTTPMRYISFIGMRIPAINGLEQ